jgi:hypothetical protein
MSNTSPGDIVSRNSKATLLTTFTAVLEAIAQQIRDDDYKKIAIPLAPFVALILIMVFKTIYKRYKCNSLIKVHKTWIVTLENESKNPTTTQSRKKEISKEITSYEAEIKKLQKEAIELEFN